MTSKVLLDYAAAMVIEKSMLYKRESTRLDTMLNTLLLQTATEVLTHAQLRDCIEKTFIDVEVDEYGNPV